MRATRRALIYSITNESEPASKPMTRGDTQNKREWITTMSAMEKAYEYVQTLHIDTKSRLGEK